MFPQHFRTITGQKLKTPVFFPDATQAVIKTLDSQDIANTQTPGILVNTYHLYRNLGSPAVKTHGGVRPFMSWNGAVISDSGGFQVMSLAKAGTHKGKITNQGVTFRPSKNKTLLFTPQKSIRFQMKLQPDMVVVLDDFTPPNANYSKAQETVNRTILWAQKSKQEFKKCCREQGLTAKNRPYLLAVVQGGKFLDLRKKCAESLMEIGFDGFGYGGWPITPEGHFNYQVAKLIAKIAPPNYFLYGLGIGKPQEIVGCVDLGYHIFDCVLPTRDARHQRLYTYNAPSIKNINIRQPRFYSYYTPTKQKYYRDSQPVSTACDCLLCTRYTRAYLAHLFRIRETTAMRLSTIHNLRFYSILMQKLQEETSLPRPT